MSTQSEWLERYESAMLPVFGAPQRALVRGEGCYVWDADGARYLDLLAGIAVDALGHAHPAWVQAVSEQAATLAHASNFFATPAQVELAERLLEVCAAPAGSRVFLANSGTEAVEAALKLARRTDRPRVLALEGAFHGRTLGALSATHKAAYRDPFAPLLPGVEHVPFGDIDALEAALAPGDVAALLLEVIQGEGGVRPLPPGYLSAARAATARHGTLLILDEVQTGMGRTGAWLAYQHPALGEGIVPDAVTVAKGLGGGFPIGALVTYGPDTSQLLQPGQHGSTFGGNALACAAALATLGVIGDLLDHVTHVSAVLRDGVGNLGHRLVTGVRGAGLLLGITLSEPVAATVAAQALDAGFIINAVAPTVIRLAPPLILTDSQAQDFLTALPALLDAATQARVH